MTQLLISVTDIKEARLALTHGADLIDLKDPRQGALGALPITTIQEVVSFVKAHRAHYQQYTSATVGDLPMERYQVNCSSIRRDSVSRIFT